MKTRHGDIDSPSSNGEDVQIDAASSPIESTIQAKDNKVQSDSASLREQSNADVEKTSLETKNENDDKHARNGIAVEQADDLEKSDVSESINQTAKLNSDSSSGPNLKTRFTVSKHAEDGDINQKSEVKEIIPPADFNEDRSSLPEVDGHISEQAKSLNETVSGGDELDRGAGQIQELEEVHDVSALSNKPGLEEMPPGNEAAPALDVKEAATNPSPSKEAYDGDNAPVKEVAANSTPSKEVGNVKEILPGTNSASNKGAGKDVPPAYDNPGFVGDEGAPAGEEAAAPRRTSTSSTKIPRRVSFSELPPKALYDGGENGKAQKDAGSGEVDFLALYGPGEKWRILRNVVLISAAFMVLFTAFFGAANLQSSVNAKAGLGTASLTTLYGALVVSNIFLPVTVIRWLRCKWTVALMALGFAPYAMAQFHAEFYTLIPTALLAGLGAAPMWCAKCTYLNVAADAYAKVTGSAPELVMVRFFGVFYVLFPLGHVWGNLISSEVLSRGGDDDQSVNITVDVAAVCGANYCPTLGATENPNLQRPPDSQINTIAGIFVACSVLGVLLVALGVDNLKRYNEGGRADSGTGLSGLELLIATARLLCDRNQIALIPITAFIGVSQAFLGADFTEGYISCAWGIPHIGYVLIGYGLASSVASVFVSWVVKTAGRLLVICSSITLFLVLVTVMKFWQPSASQGAVFFTLAALWGLADSTALVINAMYGLLFRGNEAAAYSNFSLWGSAGFIVTYSYSPYLCMNTKLAILAVILVLAMAGFVTAEMALRRIIREQQEEEKTKKSAGQHRVSIEPHVS